LPASSTPYASGTVQVRQVDASGLTSPVSSNSMALTVTPSMTVSGADDNAGTNATLLSVPARYLRITTNTANQSLNWSDLRVWVLQNGIETELTRSGWVFSGSPGGIASNLTDANPGNAYNAAAAVDNGTWLQADLGGYYSVSRVQLINTNASASNQTVSLSTNDMGASGIGVGNLLADATVQNFNTGTLGNNSTLTLKPSLATDDSTPTLQGQLPSTPLPLPNGTEYAVYITNLDDAVPTPGLLAGTFNFNGNGSDWSFTPGTALPDGRYAFTLVRQATGNSSFSNASVVPSASSLVLNIDNNGAAANPTLDLSGSAANGNDTSVDSFIGNRSPLTLIGGAASSTTAPYVNLPDVSLGGDLTLEAWVNFSALFGWERVFDIGNGSNDNNLLLGVQADGRVSGSVRLLGAPTANDFTSTLDVTHPALVTGTWYHLAYVISGTTQSVYVNGTLWATATLNNTFHLQPASVRGNTWVGRSNFGDPYSNMQVRDVRVYDDARTTAELSIDMNGTPVNVADPNLRLAYKLQGNGQSSIPGQADAELVNVNSASNSVLRLASNAVLSDASLIASITVKVTGVQDGAAEKLFVDGNKLAANGAGTSGTLTACNAQWNWTYAAATGFTFTAVGNANGGGGVPATLAQALVQSLAYQNTAIPATIGTRSFGISTTDVFGHSSSVATATLQDATLPGISNLPNTGLLLLPNQDTDLADLVFIKGDNPDTPYPLNLTVQVTNASITGLTDLDNEPANGYQLQGTAAELSSLFASARIRPAVGGGLPGLTLTLSEGANRSVTNTYPLIGDDTIAPVLDLNGAATGFNSTPVNILGTRNPINLTGGVAGNTSAPFVDLPDVALGGDFTLEAQVNFSSLFDWERVFDIGNAANDSNLLLGVRADGRVSLSLRNGSTVLVDTASTLDATHPPLITGQWYHLALVVSGTTAKAYVNGVEWVSGTLSATVSNTTRTNTWIGKSAWVNDAFSNMQVKDVRVYDDARAANELTSDMNGTAVDTSDTELRLAYPLLGDGKSSISNQADATLTNLGTVASIPVALAPSATLTENSNVRKVQVSIAGILDSTAEKLWVGNTALAADGSGTSGSVTVGTVTWAWAYAAANGPTPSGFTFTAPGTGATTLQAQGLLQAFGYSVNGPSSISNRVVSITATDVYNHTSTAVTASLLDPTVPGISNLPSMALITSRTANTPTPLADLVFNKGGNTTTSLSVNVTITATNGSVDGVTDENPATVGIQISGTPTELSAKFQNATFQANPSGVPSLSLVLSDSANHTATLAYPLTVDDMTPPVLDLNGAAAPGNDTAVGSIIGSNRPINLTGGAANSPTAPFLDLPDVPLGNALTLQAWVNFSTLDGSRVFDIGNGQNADNLILAVGSDGSVTISLRVGGTSADFANTIDNTHPALVTGQWYHMALVVSGNTQKAYVNGVEWVSHTLPAGFASNSSSTRSNTWIGKSAWAETFTNMQIRDVRIFDDARTLGEVSADAAGITPVDTQDPNLRLAYALNGNVQSSLPSGTPATAVNLNLGYSPQVLAPGATLSEPNTVRSLQIRVSGILGGPDEKLIVAGTAIAANGAATSGAVLSGSTPWNWSYASGTFTFTAPTGGVSSAVAQDLLRSLAYNDTSPIQRSGNRTVSITATDIFGNTTSTPVVATVDTALPGINNMPSNPLGVVRSTATALADLVFTKGESTSASDVLSVTVQATNATFAITGLADADPGTSGFQMTGTAAALSTQFASATLTPNASGTPTLNLTLSDAVGHTTRYSYPLVVTASESTLPVLDLNGSASGTALVQGSGIGNTQPFNLTGGAYTNTTAAYIALPNVSLGGDLTLEAQVNFTKFVNGGRVFDIGNGSNSSNLVLTVQNDGRAIMSLRNGSTPLFTDATSSQQLVPGTWYHLALVVNGLTAKTFVNGVEWMSGTLSAPITDMTRANTWIGRSNFGEAFSNMQIKDVRVFDDARTTGLNSELASDVSGTAVDLSDTNLRLAYSLEGTTASSIPGGAPAEAVNLLASNTGT
ncbi:MAG: LamG domain-containing protein, partial [Rhodoferax sp.]|nr:LamG domain-containing protein [Rhodoferax sp.]